MAKDALNTPMMKQFMAMKEKHPDAVLLFRVGDFYETYLQDAVTASEILGITLTRRSNGAAAATEMAGFPHHALDTYLPRLVRAGKRVAICDQLEDPKLTKKLVKRGITELVTPGVVTSGTILDRKENNFLAAVNFGKKNVGLALLDISTGEFLVAEGNVEYVDKLMGNFNPKEVLIERSDRKRFADSFSSQYLTFEMDDWAFTMESAMDRLLKHFETKNLKGFGVDRMECAIVSAGAIMHYLDMTQHTQVKHITMLSRIEAERYVRLDKFTVRNLELVDSMADGGKSLLSVIDRTLSPMGARLMHRWVLFPLKDVAAIERRLNVVEHFFRDPEARDLLKQQLEVMGDVERLTSKAAVGRITPRELVQLKCALQAVRPIKHMCMDATCDVLNAMGDQLNPCASIAERIDREINPDAPNQVNRGNVIMRGVDPQLDELREIAHSGKDYLMAMQRNLSETTGIPSLKIAYNNVFGYYIEVRNTHKDKVPVEWIRKQTLVNAERYVTQELKDYEEKILGAEEKILVIEAQLFNELVMAVTEFIPAIQVNCNILAQLDCLMSFTVVAAEGKYNRPVVDESLDLDITEGRHPVIERQLPPGELYVPNSLRLSNDEDQIMVITGPNMAGKSALLRQTAIIALMAQMGCYVPAQAARIGVVDKIFTRVGASDNISQGESTFMVEMTEAASILNNLSERSLVLFDELGRGTSTYDGISIAWSIVEYIHEHRARAKTLFATHYHELNEMEKNFKRIVNYNVSVKEMNGKVVFLRKIVKGGSEHSFGIHVAKLAGMPPVIVDRAGQVLKQLEANSQGGAAVTKDLGDVASSRSGYQLSIFQLDDPVLTQIRDEILHIDINNLTPMEALNKLHDIKGILTGKHQ
ncbi:DNA mismatch repair protein MutS [Sodaliphilus sp.]|uniref:DNA mismatch repair protein MutS n=1 Tax=Sodaliphilus sp. TaxID=2815818 RepID=UPI00388EA89B